MSSLRYLYLIIVVCIAVVTTQPALAHRIAHLYVQSCGQTRNEADSQWATCAGRVDRFPLDRSGFPDSKPDFTQAGYGAYGLAVSSRGTLFTAGAFGPYFEFNTIFASAFDSKKPSRSISIPPMWGCSSDNNPINVGGIAADADDNLFVSLWYNCGCLGPLTAQPARTPSGPSDWVECTGIAIFGPHQRGNEAPERNFDAGAAMLGGLAVDSHDNVYLSDQFYSDINEYVDVFGKPKQVATLNCTTGCNEAATDERDDVVVTTYDAQIWVVPPGTYPPTTELGGVVPPPRNVLTLIKYEVPGGIAATSRYIYALHNSTVEVYRATTNGPALPLFRLPVPKDTYNIAVGP